MSQAYCSPILIPPVNFALVVGDVYRSGHPTQLNYTFLETLNLKTIIYIGDAASEDISKNYQKWIDQNNITFIRLPMKSVREPFQETDPMLVETVMQLIIDERHHPILVQSDKGKHRVGVVVAVVRKCLQEWALAPIYEEYIRFAKGKTSSDFLFIEQFQPSEIKVPSEFYPKWVHGLPRLTEKAEPYNEV